MNYECFALCSFDSRNRFIKNNHWKIILDLGLSALFAETDTGSHRNNNINISVLCLFGSKNKITKISYAHFCHIIIHIINFPRCNKRDKRDILGSVSVWKFFQTFNFLIHNTNSSSSLFHLWITPTCFTVLLCVCGMVLDTLKFIWNHFLLLCIEAVSLFKRDDNDLFPLIWYQEVFQPLTDYFLSWWRSVGKLIFYRHICSIVIEANI